MSAAAAAFFAAMVLVGPAPGNPDVFHLVSTEHVTTDWMSVPLPPPPPGSPPPPADLMIRMDGLAHTNALLRNATEPGTIRFAIHVLWHGLIEIRFTDPMLGSVEARLEAATVQVAENGKISFIDFSADFILRLKVVGSVTITIGGFPISMDLNLHVLVKIVDSEIAWIKITGPAPIPFP